MDAEGDVELSGRIVTRSDEVIGGFRADEKSISVDMDNAEIQARIDGLLKNPWEAIVEQGRGSEPSERLEARIPSNVGAILQFYALLASENLRVIGVTSDPGGR